MITLSSVGWATYAADFRGAEFMVSLLSSETMIETPQNIEPENHIKLEVDDIAFEIKGRTCPNRGHIQKLLHFGKTIDEFSEVVVHCAMGRSRSPAALITLLAQRNPDMEQEIVNLVYEEAPHIQPNLLLIELADTELGCKGKLINAVEALPVHWEENFDDFVTFSYAIPS